MTKKGQCCVCDVTSETSFRSRMEELASNTSMHGLPNFLRAAVVLRKCFWASVLLIGTVTKFRAYPTATTVVIKTSTPMKFPAVSICNINPVRKTMLATNSPLYYYLNADVINETDLIDENDWDTIDNGTGYFEEFDIHSSRIFTIYQDYTKMDRATRVQIGHQLEDILMSCSFGGFHCSPRNFTHFLNYKFGNCYVFNAGVVETLTRDVERTGPEYESKMCLNHQFENKFDDFCNLHITTDLWFYDYELGDDSKRNRLVWKNAQELRLYPLPNVTVRIDKNFTEQNGLVLQLYVEHDFEYIEDMGDSVGIKLVIHDQNTMPFPEDSGYSISVGTKTAVSLSKVQIERMESPHGSCKKFGAWENQLINMYSAETGLNVDYSQEACSKTCFQKAMIEQCQCCSYSFPCNSTSLGEIIVGVGGNVTTCTGDSSMTCESSVKNQYRMNSLQCQKTCPTPCSEIAYAADISSAMWPSNPHLEEVYWALRQQSLGVDTAFTNMSYAEKEKFVSTDNIVDLQSPGYESSHLESTDNIVDLQSPGYESSHLERGNVLKLEVFFRSLNYEFIETEEAYSGVSLISDIGGQMGLWLGLSVLTLFEFLEMFVDLITIAILKAQKSGSVHHVDVRVHQSHDGSKTL